MNPLVLNPGQYLCDKTISCIGPMARLQTTKRGRKVTTMALTRDFKETILARVKRDLGFRKALLREGIENFL